MNLQETVRVVEYMNIIKFGAYISRLRKELDLPQSQLADRLNVTRQAVSKWERGESFPDISILCALAEAFGVSVDTLINAGETGESGKRILASIAKNEEIPAEALEGKDAVRDIIGIAPYLKASALSAIAEKLAANSIDISRIIELAEFMNDSSVQLLLENGNLDSPDDALLEKLIPFLGTDSMLTVLDRIIKGKNSVGLLKIMRPYADYGLCSLIEAAVIQGVLDSGTLSYFRD